MPGFPAIELEETLNETSNYTFFILLTGLALATAYAIAKLGESDNKIEYKNPTARMLSRVITYIAHLLHTKSGDIEIASKGALITAGPHLTALDAFVIATKIKGPPPQFLATDMFDSIPGVAALLDTFEVVRIRAKAKSQDGKSANAKALDEASQILKKEGCIVMFPHGNFAQIDKEAPPIYRGAPTLAVENGVPIEVIRIDGFWCLKNSLLPTWLRNRQEYRAFGALFHMNNIRVTHCCVIDFHLRPENAHMSKADLITEISAQLYAYYKYTGDLTPNQIDCIKTEISSKTHLTIWQKRVERDELGKRIGQIKQEEVALEVPTRMAMGL